MVQQAVKIKQLGKNISMTYWAICVKKLSHDLKDIISSRKYVDAYTTKNAGQDYTFHRSYLSPSRLDRAYVPNSAANSILQCYHIPTLSDHKAITLELSTQLTMEAEERNRSTYWKLNTKVLRHPDFQTEFHDFWQKITEQKPQEIGWADWWETIGKPKTREILQKVSKIQSQTRHCTRRYLYTSLDSKIKKGEWSAVQHIRQRLHNLMLEDMEGIRCMKMGSRDGRMIRLWNAKSPKVKV